MAMYLLFKNVANYMSDTLLLSLSKLDPESTMKVLRMVGGLSTNGRLVGRPMPPEDAPEDLNSPRRLTADEKSSSVSLHMQRPVMARREYEGRSRQTTDSIGSTVKSCRRRLQ